MSEPAIIGQMRAALEELQARWGGRRRPKAFYLGPADWEDFIATGPPEKATTHNLQPAWEPVFSDVPVRPSKNVPPRQSRLYDHSGTGRSLSGAAKAAAPQRSNRWREEADILAPYLDELSRERALEDWESEALEAAIRAQDGAPRPPRRPWGWTRLLAKAHVKRSGRKAGA